MIAGGFALKGATVESRNGFVGTDATAHTVRLWRCADIGRANVQKYSACMVVYLRLLLCSPAYADFDQRDPQSLLLRSYLDAVAPALLSYKQIILG